MANRKKCSTFGVWLQTDLDSAAQNLMETIIKVYICLKTRSREISIDCGSDHITTLDKQSCFFILSYYTSKAFRDTYSYMYLYEQIPNMRF